MNQSEYDPIWDKLKAEKVVKVTANRLLHARIIKAVRKRKWLDIARKLEIEPTTETMTYSTTGSIIVFRLTPNSIDAKFIL